MTPDSVAASPPSEASNDPVSHRYELLFGLTITVFAAVLALNELGGGKYGDNEIKLTSERGSGYLWYQAKGVKTTLAEGQRDTMKLLFATSSLSPEQRAAFEKQAVDLDQRIARYEQEQEEILQGSRGVGPSRWSLETDGQKGKIVGVKEMEKQLTDLALAGDRFDWGTLFLQLSLVVGAIGLLLRRELLKWVFYGGLVLLGLVGTLFSLLGFVRAGAF